MDLVVEKILFMFASRDKSEKKNKNLAYTVYQRRITPTKETDVTFHHCPCLQVGMYLLQEEEVAQQKHLDQYSDSKLKSLQVLIQQQKAKPEP